MGKKIEDERRHLLVLVSDLEFGGGQMTAIRLANALARHHHVYLYNVRSAQEESGVAARIDSAVQRLPSRGDPVELRDAIRTLGIDVVNTHVWWADAFYHRVRELFAPEERRPRWVLSMHGCYELLQIIPALDAYYLENGDAVVTDADAVVYAADKNIAHLAGRLPIAARCDKLWHGYESPNICPRNRAELGIAPNDFVFGLVSRAIPEKGWECAIAALQMVRRRGFPQAHLVLVGGGEYQEQLARQYAAAPNVHFVGGVPDPQNYISMFDVGLLPTWFVSESQPNSIIEYVAQAKPVIATTLGEIPRMLRAGEELAGILLHAAANEPLPPEPLANAMVEMLQHADRLERYATVAARAAQKFQMEDWLADYSRILFG